MVWPGRESLSIPRQGTSDAVKMLDRAFSIFARLLPDRYLKHLTYPVYTRQSGVIINEETAQKYSALYAGVGVIAETIALLPWHTYERAGENKRRRTSNQASKLLNTAPNEEMTAGIFRETIISHAILWGNGYAWIERDMAGRPRGLWLITPDRVTPKRNDLGKMVYEVRNDSGPSSLFPANEIFHLRGRGFDGMIGYSLVWLAARSLGLAISTEEFNADLYTNGVFGSGVLEHPGRLGDEAHNRLKEDFETEHVGAGRRHKPIILEGGMQWKQTAISPEDAQLLQSREMNVNEIARWLRLPPHKLGDLRRSTFTNIEHQSREFVGDAILPWTLRLEQEANAKLFRTPSAYTKLDVNGLMRGDSQAQADYFQKMAGIGVYTINEIRALQDQDPVGPDGDKRLVPMNMTTIERMGEEEPQQAAAPVQELTEAQQAAHTRAIANIIDRSYRKQRHRADSAVKRYRDDREGFSEWLNTFHSDDFKAAYRDALRPMLELYSSATRAPGDAVTRALSHSTDLHVQSARGAMWSHFDNDEWDESLAAQEAEHIVQLITDIALIEDS